MASLLSQLPIYIMDLFFPIQSPLFWGGISQLALFDFCCLTPVFTWQKITDLQAINRSIIDHIGRTCCLVDHPLTFTLHYWSWSTCIWILILHIIRIITTYISLLILISYLSHWYSGIVLFPVAKQPIVHCVLKRIPRSTLRTWGTWNLEAVSWSCNGSDENIHHIL